MFQSSTTDQAKYLLTNKDATKANLEKVIPNVGTVHIASHGIQITDLGTDRKAAAVYSRHPLLKSSIALTNANLDGLAGQLSGEEVMQMDLSHVGLAVLSTCYSARGQVFTSEGAFGMEKAFRLAGTHSTLTSQSALDDKIAKKFVERFYHFWKQVGLSKSAALKQTQIEMIKNNVPIQYWSGWRLRGDWR